MDGCGRRFSQEKTFADSPKTTKFTKIFSLESFPLYGIHLYLLYYLIRYLQSLSYVDGSKLAIYGAVS